MAKKWDGPHPERMKKPWNCCQDCGRELDKDRDDVFGEFVGDDRAVEALADALRHTLSTLHGR